MKLRIVKRYILFMFLAFTLTNFLANIPQFKISLTQASSTPTFKVEPPTSTANVNDYFTVNVSAYDVLDLYAWQVFMTWDPTVLEATEVVFGDILAGQPGGTTPFFRINNEDGFTMVSEKTNGDYAGVDGDGWLCSITFQAEILGETALEIDNEFTLYMDSFLNTIGDDPGEMIKEDGFFSNVGVTHTLTVNSDPISSIDFTVDGVPHTTPWSDSLAEGSHTVVMPSTWTDGPDTYNFDHWEDMSTNPSRTISLTTGMTVTAYYVIAPKYWTLTVNSDPVTGVEFTLNGVPHTTSWSDSLDEGSYTVVMPSTWDIYDFDHWDDMSTDPTKVIDLTSDITITAYYVKRQWTLTVNSEPISGISFTVDDVTHTTPWSDLLDEGDHTVVMPSSWDIYDFDQWEDASTNPTRTVSLTANTVITAYYVAREWTLNVNSDPITGVEFTLDDVTYTTPYSDSLVEGSYTLVMPSTWTEGADEYTFTQWEDMSTNPTRTISLTADMTVTAYYVLAPKYWTLAVNSDPITGVEFTLDGVTYTTPYSDSLIEGSHTIVMPSTWDIYDFDHWDDLSTDPSRTISLTADTTITAYYVKRQWTLNVNSDPIDGIDFTIDGATQTTPWSDVLDEGSYTVVMPLTWTTGAGDVYQFDQWDDASTDPARIISLTSDMTVTAYYVYVPETYELTVNSDPITGVEFTVDDATQYTPWTGDLAEGSHTLVMSSSWGAYDFDHWDDMSTDPTRVVDLTSDTTVTAYYVKRQWTLNVNSDPISGIDFTVDDVTHTTPWSGLLDQGDHTIVMPSSWDIYDFDHWDDLSTDPSRTISLTADTTITAYFVEHQWTLTVNSDPITGVEFTLNDVTYTTPYSDSLSEGSYTVVMPSTWDIYDFDQWDDMVTDPTRVIDLTCDMTVTAYYVKRQWTLTVNSDPIDGIEFTVDGVTHATPWSDILDEGSYTVVMPSTWTVGDDFYSFDHWDDMSTDRSRTISLTSEMTVTAYYELVPPTYWTLTVNSDPIDGVDFAVDDVTHTTPWSDSLLEGSYTVVMPSSWTDGADVYSFDHWDDMSTNPTRVIDLTSDMTITAYYVLAPIYWTLTVNSDPITGVEFWVGSATQYTPWTGDLAEGSHTIVMSSSWGAYDFDHWDDMSTDPSRTISLTADMTLTAIFVEKPALPLIYVDPEESTANPSESFTINVNIQDVIDLYGYELKMSFDPDILEVAYHLEDSTKTYHIGEGPFLKQTVSPYGTYFAAHAYRDYIHVSGIVLGAYPGVSGSGTLFNVTFNVIDYGECTLHPYDSIPLDSNGVTIEHNIADGYFYTPMAFQYQLTIEVVGSGTTNPVPDTYTYDEDTLVEVDAIPDEGWMLDHWELDGQNAGADDPITVLMDSDHALTAFFVEAVDTTPPTITINEPTAKDYLHSETITLDFSAADAESGIASITAMLNGEIVESGDSIELYTLPLGEHTLTVTAVDNAGNSATETVEFNLSATVGSLKDLVNMFYESGFFYSPKGMRTSLLSKLYAAERYINAGHIDDAKDVLGAFIHQVKAQSGKHISEYAANILITDAQYIIDNL